MSQGDSTSAAGREIVPSTVRSIEVLNVFPLRQIGLRSKKHFVLQQQADGFYQPRLKQGSLIAEFVDDYPTIGPLYPMLIGPMLGTGAGMVGGFPFALLEGVGSNAGGNLMAAAAAAGVGGGAILSAASIPFLRRWWNRAKLELGIDFSSWAYARYGLEIDPNQLSDELLSLISQPQNDLKHAFFQSGEQWFKVVSHEKAFYIEQHQGAIAKDYSPVGGDAVGLEDSLAQVRTLPGEAGLLGENLLNMLSLCANEDLTVEQDHVVRRVRADLLQAIATHAKLAKISSVNADDIAALQETVATLSSEVKQIIDGWGESLRNELQVQRAYVKERQLHPHHLTLPAALPAATEPAELP